MNYDYYKLPFGGQLLLWTSRVAFHGSCQVSPNKYQIIGMAFHKVGIYNGCNLLKSFLNPLTNNPLFEIQSICKPTVTDNEINLINCLHEHTQSKINNSFYIKLWSLEKTVKIPVNHSVHNL